MGLVNWAMKRWFDAFLRQPPETKADLIGSVVEKAWSSATPAEAARLAELLLPRFLDLATKGAGEEARLAAVRAMMTPEAVQQHVGRALPALLPGLLSSAFGAMGDDEKRRLLAAWLPPAPPMPPMPPMPAPPDRDADTPRRPTRRPDAGMGGMMGGMWG